MAVINTIFNKNNTIAKHSSEGYISSEYAVPQVLPLWLRRPDGAWYQLPIEPLISISSGNVIVKRNIAKGQHPGTVKERWNTDDVQVTIEGIFCHQDANTYPDDDVKILNEILQQQESIEVQNELLQLLDINRIVVETWDIPHTSGENRQKYTIRALSDHNFELLIERK